MLDKIRDGVYIDNVKLKVANVTKKISHLKNKIIITIFEGRKEFKNTIKIWALKC